MEKEEFDKFNPNRTPLADDEEGEDDGARGAGAEVAPPCDMNYFSSAATQNPRGFRSHHDMAEAFSAGLQASKK